MQLGISGVGLFYLCFSDHACKSARIAHGHVCQHLAVDGNLILLHAMDKAAVGYAVLPGGSVNARDPKPPQITFARAAITIGVPETLQHGLVSPPVELAASAVLTFGHLEDFFVPLTAMRSSFYTWHLFILFHVGSQTVHPFCDPPPFGGDHFHKQALGAFWCDTSSVTFSDFGPYKLTGTCQAKPFGSSLMGLQLVFSGFFLSRHNLTPVAQNPRILISSAEMIGFLILG